MHFHIAQNGREYGPLTVDEIRKRMEAGDFSEDDLAWTEGMESWKPLREALPEPLTPPPLFQQAGVPRPLSAPQRQMSGAGEDARTSGLAGGSLICGLLGFVLLFPCLLAVIFGHVARGAIARSGGSLKGAGMALAGLIMGYVVMALIPVIAVVAALMVPAFSGFAEKAVEIRCANNARQLVMGLKNYAADNDGRFPPDLETLFQEGILQDRKLLECPLQSGQPDLGWEYRGAGLKEDVAGDTILLITAGESRRGWRVVCRADGLAEVLSRDKLRLLEDSR